MCYILHFRCIWKPSYFQFQQWKPQEDISTTFRVMTSQSRIICVIMSENAKKTWPMYMNKKNRRDWEPKLIFLPYVHHMLGYSWHKSWNFLKLSTWSGNLFCSDLFFCVFVLRQVWRPTVHPFLIPKGYNCHISE